MKNATVAVILSLVALIAATPATAGDLRDILPKPADVFIENFAKIMADEFGRVSYREIAIFEKESVSGRDYDKPPFFARSLSGATAKTVNDIETLKELRSKFKQWTGIKAKIELNPEENAAARPGHPGGQSIPPPRFGFQPSSTLIVGARLGVKGTVNFDEVLRPSVFAEWRNRWKGEELIVLARHTFVADRTAVEIKTGERFWRDNGFQTLYEQSPDGTKTTRLESFLYLDKTKKETVKISAVREFFPRRSDGQTGRTEAWISFQTSF
ncbi:MAG: hypothetical protein HZA37_00375 [Parcubacteria group bacterium]|nr:hypothetical protein [Parcubacteria group bacterium]